MSAAERKHEFVDSMRREQILSELSFGRRLDGRKFDDYRPIEIQIGPIVKADGSAMVKIGNTTALVGVKVQVGNPFPDTPDEDTIELSRVVDRGIRESHMLDMESLAIVKGKKVYAVFVDVTVLDVDGNLFDAVSYAAVAALATTKYRKAEVKGEEVSLSEERVQLKPKTIPISVTTAKIGEYLVIDPDGTEEAVMDARVTFTYDSKGRLCATQKGGTFGFTPAEILKQVETARLKAAQNRKILEDAIKVAKKK